LKWSDLRYVFDIKEDCNGKKAFKCRNGVRRIAQDVARFSEHAAPDALRGPARFKFRASLAGCV